METNGIYSRLTTVLQEVFDADDLVACPELTAADVEEWDSLNHVRLILSIEKAFQIRFSASEIANLRNVGDLATLIQSKA